MWWRHSYPTAAREIWKGIHQDARQVSAVDKLLPHCWFTCWASSRPYQNDNPFCKSNFILMFSVYSSHLSYLSVSSPSHPPCPHEVLNWNLMCFFFCPCNMRDLVCQLPWFHHLTRKGEDLFSSTVFTFTNNTAYYVVKYQIFIAFSPFCHRNTPASYVTKCNIIR